jgi:hypothetical protein
LSGPGEASGGIETVSAAVAKIGSPAVKLEIRIRLEGRTRTSDKIVAATELGGRPSLLAVN